MKKTLLLSLLAAAGYSAFPANATQLLWGDTHLRTFYSGAALALGDKSADKERQWQIPAEQTAPVPWLHSGPSNVSRDSESDHTY